MWFSEGKSQWRELGRMNESTLEKDAPHGK